MARPNPRADEAHAARHWHAVRIRQRRRIPSRAPPLRHQFLCAAAGCGYLVPALPPPPLSPRRQRCAASLAVGDTSAPFHFPSRTLPWRRDAAAECSEGVGKRQLSRRVLYSCFVRATVHDDASLVLVGAADGAVHVGGGGRCPRFPHVRPCASGLVGIPPRRMRSQWDALWALRCGWRCSASAVDSRLH